jgi:hypothetical protein
LEGAVTAVPSVGPRASHSGELCHNEVTDDTVRECQSVWRHFEDVLSHDRNPMRRHFSKATAIFILLGAVAVYSQDPNDSNQPESDGRYEFMQGQAEAFEGSLRKGGKIKSLDAPLLRWTNPYTNIRDGVLVGWVDEAGVPVAAAQICLTPNSTSQWAIELQSLTVERFTLSNGKMESWKPNRPGVQWHRYDKVGIPAEGAPRRLVQMRTLARRFRGDDDFENEESVLRLLTNPLVRYSKPDDGLVDGGMFALVHGTDPEMLIMIEARKDENEEQPAYHWALAPMTSFELRGYLDREQVWHKPQMTSNRPIDIFFQRLLVQDREEDASVLSKLKGLLDF